MAAIINSAFLGAHRGCASASSASKAGSPGAPAPQRQIGKSGDRAGRHRSGGRGEFVPFREPVDDLGGGQVVAGGLSLGDGSAEVQAADGGGGEILRA